MSMEIIAAIIGILFMFFLIFLSLREQKTLSPEELTQYKKELVKPLN